MDVTLEFSNVNFKVDARGPGRKERGKIWVSLITTQPKAADATKPWTTQMQSLAVRDDILSEARVGTVLEKAPVRLQEFCIHFASPTAMKNEFDSGLLFLFPVLMWLPRIHPKLPVQPVNVEDYLKLNFQTVFSCPLQLRSEIYCLKDLSFPVTGTQF